MPFSAGEKAPAGCHLLAKGFIREGMDLDALSRKVRTRRGFLGSGPHLVCMITTLRCNQSCRYCHASRTSMDKVETDMSLDIAKKAVDQSLVDFLGGDRRTEWLNKALKKK